MLPELENDNRDAGVFLSYQKRYVADESPVIVVEKSRRVGLTWGQAAKSVLKASRRNGRDQWYIGYSKDMAEEFISDCAMWARSFDQAAGDVEEDVLEDEDKDIKVFRVTFASGYRITALSSRPKNLRGKQGDVIIDEAAFHQDLAELIKAAIALLMWGGSVSIISTHDGDDSEFNELIQQIRAGKLPYSLHKITLDDALQDGLYRAICRKLGKEWSQEDEDAWRDDLIASYGDAADEELFVIPARGSGVYFPRTLVQSCMTDEYRVLTWVCKKGFELLPDDVREQECQDWLEANVKPELEKIGPGEACWFGEDFGRSGDLTGIWPLIQKMDLSFHTPFVIELSNVPFKQQEQVLFYVADWFRDNARLMGGALDARGNGQYLAEVAMQRYGEDRIHQVMLSNAIYQEWMPKYKTGYEDRTFLIPKNANIVDDHRQVRMEKGIAKVPESGRTKSKSGIQRHGDLAIAGMLANYARETLEGGTYEHMSTGEKRAAHELEEAY